MSDEDKKDPVTLPPTRVSSPHVEISAHQTDPSALRHMPPDVQRFIEMLDQNVKRAHDLEQERILIDRERLAAEKERSQQEHRQRQELQKTLTAIEKNYELMLRAWEGAREDAHRIERLLREMEAWRSDITARVAELERTKGS